MTREEIIKIYGTDSVGRVEDIQQIADSLVSGGVAVIVTVAALMAIRLAFMLIWE